MIPSPFASLKPVTGRAQYPPVGYPTADSCPVDGIPFAAKNIGGPGHSSRRLRLHQRHRRRSQTKSDRSMRVPITDATTPRFPTTAPDTYNRLGPPLGIDGGNGSIACERES